MVACPLKCIWSPNDGCALLLGLTVTVQRMLLKSWIMNPNLCSCARQDFWIILDFWNYNGNLMLPKIRGLACTKTYHVSAIDPHGYTRLLTQRTEVDIKCLQWVSHHRSSFTTRDELADRKINFTVNLMHTTCHSSSSLGANFKHTDECQLHILFWDESRLKVLRSLLWLLLHSSNLCVEPEATTSVEIMKMTSHYAPAPYYSPYYFLETI